MEIVDFIEDYGPRSVERGLKFNSANPSWNAVWVQVSHHLGRPVVTIDGYEDFPITPAYDIEAKLLSFKLSAGLTELEGEIKFKIVDLRSEFTSPEMVIAILPNTKGTTEEKGVRSGLVELSSLKSRVQSFSGLGLSTEHALPWQIDPVSSNQILQIHNQIENEFEFSFPDTPLKGSLDEFLWRTSIVVYVAKYCCRNLKNDDFIFVECGVGDGISAFAVMSVLQENLSSDIDWHAYLFDLWRSSNEKLEGLEKNLKGVYDAMSFERTRKNLSRFATNSHFVKGKLPQSLKDNLPSVAALSLVHIDLNFAEPTLACLETLYPRLAKGGVVLFDDYGWSPHEQTRQALLDFISSNGTFFMLPSGQAVLLKI